MERTKGKVETKEETDGHFGIYLKDADCDCIAIVWAHEGRARTCAEHFVNCWNAFEEGGPVEKLVYALEEVAEIQKEVLEELSQAGRLKSRFHNVLSFLVPQTIKRNQSAISAAKGD